MSRRNLALWVALIVIASFAGLGAALAQYGGKPDVAAAITKMENDSVKADLAGDTAFYEKLMAGDWSGGDSDGTWYTKAEALKLMADTQHNKTKTEELSDLKVRVYGNAAVATYKDTYDSMFKGEHRVRTVIATDTFAKVGADWKIVASHSSVAK